MLHDAQLSQANPTTLVKHFSSLVLQICVLQMRTVIPISDNTMQRCVSDTASDVKDQLLDCVCESPSFSFQLDGSAYITNSDQLRVYVC